MKFVPFLFLLVPLVAQAVPLSFPTQAGVRSCGTVELSTTFATRSLEGASKTVKVHELSGVVAIGQGANTRLVAVSDRAALVHLQPSFDKQGALKDAEIKLVTPLRQKNGTPHTKSTGDAEGLAYDKSNNTLLISFERSPRVERYSLAGEFIEEMPLAASAKDLANFDGSNHALEALAYVDQRVLTAPERAHKTKGIVPLFDDKGIRALYPLHIPKHNKDSLTGLDQDPSGTIWALERDYHKRKGRIIISIHQIKLPKTRGDKVTKKTRLVMNNLNGTLGLDNFEGIAALSSTRILIISDDNKSKDQKSLLSCLDFAP